MGQSVKRAVKPESRRNKINERRLVCDHGLTKQLSALDVAVPPVRLNPPPVIRALENVLAVLRNL